MCVYETGLLLLFARRISAASIELLPRSRRAAVFPRWLHVRKLKLLDEPHSLFVVASAACVYETGLLLPYSCICRTSAPAVSVEPLPRLWRAVAFLGEPMF